MTSIVSLVRHAGNRAPWQQNLMVLWIAQFIAMIGMSACIPFLPLFVRELGVSASDAPMWSGIITAAPFLMASALTPLWGALGDKYGQKTMVVRAILGLGVAMTLMGLSTNIWMLFALRIFQGAVSGFVASNNAFVSAQTPTAKVGVALGTIQTSISAGNIVGPLVGGVVSDAVGFRPVFFLVGLLCAASLYVVVRFVHEEKHVQRGPAPRVLGNIRTAWQMPQLRITLFMVLISQTAIVLPSPIFPYYLEALGAPPALLSTLSGIIVSIVGVCTIISAPWWGARADKHGSTRTIIIAGSIMVFGMLLQSIVPSYHWLYPVRTMMGLAVGAIVPMLYGALTRYAPEGSKGGIMGLASSATLLGNLAGPIICSAIASVMPLPWVFLASAGFMSAVVYLAMRNRKRVQHSLENTIDKT